MISILTAFMLIGSFTNIFNNYGLHSDISWSLISAAILIALNLGYILHLSRIKQSEKYSQILTNIWFQIVADLIVLTGVLHFIGTLETYLTFAYIFHIVLACIFFSGRQSFAVTVIVCILYLGVVSAEKFSIIPASGIYENGILRQLIDNTPFIFTFNVFSAMSIWLIAWYLASHLSGMVREREYELAKANRDLKTAQEAKTKHLLRITHELKAPFAAIDANTQLLLNGHCGFLPDEALKVLERIALRSRKLGHEIQEMLQLANLSSIEKKSLKWQDINLSEIINWCHIQIKPAANKRNIRFAENIEDTHIIAVQDHMKMLFMNVISNAVIYSHDSGVVTITCRRHDGNGPTVIIEDNGIGISAEKLPKIFDEYYRTDEAAVHNKSSTGLGLAIVRHVAQTHNIKIRISSLPQKGTKFELRFTSSNN